MSISNISFILLKLFLRSKYMHTEKSYEFCED